MSRVSGCRPLEGVPRAARATHSPHGHWSLSPLPWVLLFSHPKYTIEYFHTFPLLLTVGGRVGRVGSSRTLRYLGTQEADRVEVT